MVFYLCYRRNLGGVDMSNDSVNNGRNEQTNEDNNLKNDNYPSYEQLDKDIENIKLEYLNENFNITTKFSDRNDVLSYISKNNSNSKNK